MIEDSKNRMKTTVRLALERLSILECFVSVPGEGIWPRLNNQEAWDMNDMGLEHIHYVLLSIFEGDEGPSFIAWGRTPETAWRAYLGTVAGDFLESFKEEDRFKIIEESAKIKQQLEIAAGKKLGGVT